MSKGKKETGKGGTVLEMPSESEPVIDGAPQTEPETVETPPRGTAPPEPAIAQPKQRKTTSGWDRVRAIPDADWGERAFLYIYCLEPICDLKGGGEKKYLVKLKRPIFDEDAIMIDYGSGKYRLQLVYRKPAADKADQIDSWEIEIYNPKFPPKIPEAVWMNDPRNARWKALLPKEEPPKTETPIGTMTETFKMFSDMRKDVREELAPVAEAPKTADPFDLATRILQIQNGNSNPIITLFEKQMDAMSKSADAARQREADLQKEIRDQLRAQTQPTDRMDPLDMLLKASDKLQPLIDKFMPKLTEAAGNVVQRASRPRVSEQLIDVGLPILGQILTPFANLLAAKMAQAPQQTGGLAPAAPPQNGAPAALPPATNGQQPQQRPNPAPGTFLNLMMQPIAVNAFRKYFDSYTDPGNADMESGARTTGADFAQWVYDAEGEQPLKDARGLGSIQILQMFKMSQVWPAFQPKESKLASFIDEALAWRADGGEPEPEADENQVDLTAHGM